MYGRLRRYARGALTKKTFSVVSPLRGLSGSVENLLIYNNVE